MFYKREVATGSFASCAVTNMQVVLCWMLLTIPPLSNKYFSCFKLYPAHGKNIRKQADNFLGNRFQLSTNSILTITSNSANVETSDKWTIIYTLNSFLSLSSVIFWYLLGKLDVVYNCGSRVSTCHVLN
jgi:hypothetical protein